MGKFNFLSTNTISSVGNLQLSVLLQELVEDVAIATSSRHANLSWARRFAVASPRFIGRRSASTVLSQDCLGRPALRLQSPIILCWHTAIASFVIQAVGINEAVRLEAVEGVNKCNMYGQHAKTHRRQAPVHWHAMNQRVVQPRLRPATVPTHRQRFRCSAVKSISLSAPGFLAVWAMRHSAQHMFSANHSAAGGGRRGGQQGRRGESALSDVRRMDPWALTFQKWPWGAASDISVMKLI